MKRISLSVLIVVLLVSCKVTKTSTTDYEYKADTYEHVESNEDFSITTDSTTEVTRDSSSVTRTDTYTITFAEQGGSFNINTGEAIGVIGVTKTENLNEINTSISTLTHTADSLRHTLSMVRDSISNVTEEEKSEEQVTKDYKFPWWLFFVGLGVGVASIVFLKKFTLTKPLMLWL